MRRDLQGAAAVLLVACAAVACNSSRDRSAAETPAESRPLWRYIETGDLPAIRQRGSLRVLVPSRPEREHLPRSEDPFQRERDLVEEFSRELQLELVYVPVERENYLPWLLEGKGDIALVKKPDAGGETPFAYTLAVKQLKEVVVVRAGHPEADGVADLAGRHVAVFGSGVLTRPIEALREDLPGVELYEATDVDSPDDLLYEVATGRVEAALVDSNWMQVAEGYRSDLQVALELPEEQPLVAAVRADATRLRQAMNDYLVAALSNRGRRRLSTADLPGIREGKVLRVLTLNRAPNYFLSRGVLRGFEFELAREFARRNRLRLEVVVPPDRRDLIPWLLEGRGDLVAADFRTADVAGRDGVAASTSYQEVRDVVVARPDDETAPESVEELAGREVWLSASSAARPAIQHARLHPVAPGISASDIIDRVAGGEYDLGVVPGHVLRHELAWRNDLRVVFEIGEPVRHVWLLRKPNQVLLQAVNDFLEAERGTTFYNVVRNRYFPRGARAARRIWEPDSPGQISPYDSLVRRHAETYDINWLLALALMYQESRFDPNARSAAGAVGLFQMLPTTARELGYTRLRDPEVSIEAALKYIHWIRERFEPDLDFAELAAFTGASYNAGYGHVLDARRLAEEMGHDPNRWFGSVEQAMLMLSKPEIAKRTRFGYCRGLEPYLYVRQIRDRFQVYLRATGGTANRN